jgi:hypothetical protein
LGTFNRISLSFSRCRTFFCYLCGDKLPTENPYSHFSDLGVNCYNKLFEGVDDEFVFMEDEDGEDQDDIENIVWDAERRFWRLEN